MQNILINSKFLTKSSCLICIYLFLGKKEKNHFSKISIVNGIS